MHSRHRIFLTVLSLVVACRRPELPRVDSTAVLAADTVEPSRVSRAPDSAKAPFPVDRPVLIAFFAVTQAEADSSDDVGEAMDDFQHYLPAIKLGLDSLDVALRVQYTDTVRYLANGRPQVWTPATDSADIGYLLLRPDAEPRVQYAVSTSGDVIGQVKEWLGSRAP